MQSSPSSFPRLFWAWLSLGLVGVVAGLGFTLVGLPAQAQPRAEEIINSLGMKFVPIPRGTFQMGSVLTDELRVDDEFPHTVHISKSFYMGAFEVTQKQYRRVMGDNPSFFTTSGPGRTKIKTKDTFHHPVEDVTWFQSIEFCAKLGAMEDEKDRKFTYRLPTEAEWEYACRAGTSTSLAFGEDISSFEANFNGVAPLGKGRTGPFVRATWPVGGYKANAFGLSDMHGNVMEWCADWYADDFYKTSPKDDPQGPIAGTGRVFRGGGWANSARGCRSAARNKFPPDHSSYNIGFRVVLIEGE